MNLPLTFRIIFFGDLFQIRVSFVQEFSHVLFEKEFICDDTQKPQRSYPDKRISHESSGVCGKELVNMPQLLKNTLRHLIDKTVWLLELDNFGSQALCHAEVDGFKSDTLAMAD
jgi:hypothetical protein